MYNKDHYLFLCGNIQMYLEVAHFLISPPINVHKHTHTVWMCVCVFTCMYQSVYELTWAILKLYYFVITIYAQCIYKPNLFIP